MDKHTDLYPLLTWMSPSYPVGSFTFSQGLEYAIEIGTETGELNSAVEITQWLSDLLRFGNGYSDLVFLSTAWDCAYDKNDLEKLLELANSFQNTSELLLETRAQGAAFFDITSRIWPCDTLCSLATTEKSMLLYPIVVGVAARGHHMDKMATLSAYGHAWLSNLVSAAVRLVPLGQSDGQSIIAELQHILTETIESAEKCTPSTLSTSTFMSDIYSMQHETQYTRLFRS